VAFFIRHKRAPNGVSADHRCNPLVPRDAYHNQFSPCRQVFAEPPGGDALRRRPAQGGAVVTVASCAG